MTEEIAPGDEPPTEEPKYDQEFFLKLAREGKKDEWNAWRHDQANEGVRVTFAGIDFSEAPWDEIDFSGFEFGDYADFSHCKWQRGNEPEYYAVFRPYRGTASFTDATFGQSAKFDHAAFGRDTSFNRTAFGGAAAFTRATFGHRTRFAGATFGNSARFTGASFEADTDFSSVTFAYNAEFTGATFAPEAREIDEDRSVMAVAVWGRNEYLSMPDYLGTRFNRAVFGAGADFTGAAFGGKASFIGTAFGDRAEFYRATFDREAIFVGAAFGNRSRFDRTIFKGRVDFVGVSIERHTRHVTVTGEEEDALEVQHKEFWTRDYSGPDCFLAISFAGARFEGEAIFFGRSFEDTANFANARFYVPPNFDAVTNAHRVDFTGAHIGFAPPGYRTWTRDSKVPLRLRALRKIAEETKNHDLERDLYIEERNAERGVYWYQLVDELKRAPEELRKQLEEINKQKRDVWSEWRLQVWARNAHRLGIAVLVGQLAIHGLWIVVMGVYWALADYGRSFVRPAAWLGLSVPLFHWGYDKILAPLIPQAGTLDADKYERAVWMVGGGNAVPFVGPLTIDAEIKKFLFCPGFGPCLPLPPEGFQLLAIAQNLVSITCVFFIGLALRNYFRIK